MHTNSSFLRQSASPRKAYLDGAYDEYPIIPAYTVAELQMKKTLWREREKHTHIRAHIRTQTEKEDNRIFVYFSTCFLFF